jgi:flagellar hook-associated protein 3 FlgL
MLSSVTNLSQVNTVLYYLDQQSDSLANLTEQASSGNQILVPSDNPAGTVSVMSGNAQDTQLSAYLTNITSATNTLNQSVSSLASVVSVLQQAASIASQGANSTTTSAAYEPLAEQVDGLINQVIGLANTQFNGQYLYGGTATDTTPFSVSTTNSSGQPETIAYNGATDPGQTVVGSSQAVDTAYNGSQVFQSGTGNVFQALTGLRDLLLNTAGQTSTQQQQALSQQIGVITNAETAVQNVEGKQSADLQNLGTMQTQVTNLQTANKTQVSDLQSADLPTVLENLQAEENAYQVTLAAAGRIFDQNLLDFLPTQTL